MHSGLVCSPYKLKQTTTGNFKLCTETAHIALKRPQPCLESRFGQRKRNPERLNSAYEVMGEKQEKLVFPSMYLLAKTLKPVPNAKTRAVRAAFCTSNTGVSRFLSDYFREARHELELLMKQQYGYEI